ncbi:hypothetical protein NBM05_03750 [Rothia sp. AR01]|uniref:Uncharacterized protein n=1 Tax=Rothia santali TaxID=2949643 RepID=A0A9X2HE50_9MICC|nr:hypothetical protein [Rothia santali]MCP3425162.1 hypothetical protein [Rothia santali]
MSTTSAARPLGLIFAASHEAAMAQSIQRMEYGLKRLDDEHQTLLRYGASAEALAANRLTHHHLQDRYAQLTDAWHVVRAELELMQSYTASVDPLLPHRIRAHAGQHCPSTATGAHRPVITCTSHPVGITGSVSDSMYQCAGCAVTLGETSTPTQIA